jgi:hypothetical protein
MNPRQTELLATAVLVCFFIFSWMLAALAWKILVAIF